MKTLVVANWKMQPATYKEAKKLFEATKKAAEGASTISLIVAPPALYLQPLASLYKGKRIAFAVQNAHTEIVGAYTGEVSFEQAHDAKASYAIIGHAERRAIGETDDEVRAKVRAAIAEKMIPILCVGEKQRGTDGSYFTLIREQLRVGLADVPSNKLTSVIIAYEPVWAIGAAKSMSARDMHEMAIYIRKSIVELYGQAGMSMRILYGGAIDETNAAEMMEYGDVSGLLIGRASADAKKLSSIFGVLS